jgi:hypothetical protein
MHYRPAQVRASSMNAPRAHSLCSLSLSLLDCNLLLWDTHSQETLDRYKSDVALAGVAWRGNTAALLTRDGQLALWQDVVPSNLASPSTADAKAAVFAQPAAKLAALFSAAADDAANTTYHGADVSDDDNADDERHRLASQQRAPRRLLRKFGDAAADADDSTADDAPHQQQQQQQQQQRSSVATMAQAAFMPNASAGDAKRRFLAWNMTGLVTLRDDAGQGFIEIEFHDQQTYRNRNFTDHNGVMMAAMGSEGVAFGSARDADHHVAAGVHYRAHEAAGTSFAWTARLPAHAELLALAAAPAFVVAATSERLLRFFSPHGSQTALRSTAGDVVTLAASAESHLAIVCSPSASVCFHMIFDDDYDELTACRF